MKTILTLFITLFSSTLWADALVYKVQKGTNVFYIGGTIHLLRESDLVLPSVYDAAYKLSDTLVFETSIGELGSTTMQQKMLKLGMYQDGSTLKSHISKKSYTMLKSYCDQNAIPIASIERFKPFMVMLTLMGIELMKQGINQEGVDHIYYTKALADKKRIAQLESVDEQLSYLAGLGRENEDELIAYTLRDIESLPKIMDRLIEDWKEGNVKDLVTLMIDALKKETPQIYHDLLVTRNNNWMPMIETMAKTPEIEFILVGSAHLIGADGLLQSLKERGFSIQNMR